MPRPTDNYAHSQFESVESDFVGETVRCVHCKNWTGSVKTLHRKKEHLLRCPQYLAWREAGNGQDLAPPNKYSKRPSMALDDADQYTSPYADVNNGNMDYTNNAMARNRVLDLNKHFDEFWDDDSAQKCMRARCKFCGYVRAKNSTRQFEHLQQCHEFHTSTDGQEAIADGLLAMPPPDGTHPVNANGQRDIFRGGAPNPNLVGVNNNRAVRGPGRPTATPTRPPPAPMQAPSLVNHLLTKNNAALQEATQLQFLSHAGCGTLSVEALQQFFVQQGHISRAVPTLLGSLIAKIRLPETMNPSQDGMWRAFDLLVSTVNNAKRELDFLRNTRVKYNLQNDGSPVKPGTKVLVDLMASVSAPAASLLEGLVVLWAIEYLHCVSWQYASSFIQQRALPPTTYSLPSYINNHRPGMPPTYPAFGAETADNRAADNTHTAALHEALIPNWTSQGFIKFVDACKSLVDELANSQTTGNGAPELINCETVFKQVIWSWKQVWPEVTGMGEENEEAENGDENGVSADEPIEIEDDAPTAEESFSAA